MEDNKIEVRDLRNGDWYWIHKIVYEEYAEKIGIGGLAAYNALCYYSNQKSECFPSLNTMAKKLNCSIPTLLKYLSILEKYKLIKKVNRQKENLPNIYYLIKIFNKGTKNFLQGLIKNFNTNNNNITRINNNIIKKYKISQKTVDNLQRKYKNWIRDNPSYQKSFEGFVDQLKKEGYFDGKNYN